MDLLDIARLKNFDKLRAKLAVKPTKRGRWHFSDNPITDVWDTAARKMGRADYKPVGLWYSVGYDWPKFILKESDYSNWAAKRFDEYLYVYRLDMSATPGVLSLKTKRDFKEFTFHYGVFLPSHGATYPYLINWRKVAKDHKGVECRHCEDWYDDYLWFRTWDCTSGCIWDKTALKGLRLVHDFNV